MTKPTQRVAIVTGSNTGLGFETVLALFRQGLHVIVACRSAEKGEAAVGRICASVPETHGKVEFARLNLSNLGDVKNFADEAKNRLSRLDLLINNAGVMVPPAGLTDDGYETQFGVNFIAHFALTGHLFNLLESTPGARVVTLSSIGHRGAAIDFNNFKLQKPYEQWREYGQSKLADLVFALEFDRRLKLANRQLISLAAHPGVSQTELTRSLAEIPEGLEFMSAEEGAAPTLMAATSPTAQGGQYYGPDGPGERSGKPALAAVDDAAQNAELNAKLWDWAQDATGLRYP